MRYIGSKKLLLPEIKKMLDKHVIGDEKIFLDLFGGTNSVGLYFKKHYTIYSNDLLYFSYVNAKALIENNSQPTFNQLVKNGISNPLEFLMKAPINNSKIGYYEQSYSPTGDAMYISTVNAKKIDVVRDTLSDWQSQGLITQLEFFYLLNCLIESIPFVSNITGTYGAFLKYWDKRALNNLQFEPSMILDNERHNKAFNENANELVKKISADIVYIDTPYNSRQYASNYHLLENVARNSKPELKGITKIFDWKNLKSNYSNTKAALIDMEELLHNIDSTHIILSYNNEGIISEDDLHGLMKKASSNNLVDVCRIPYRKYQSKKKSTTSDVYELLFYIQKKNRTKRISNSKAASPNIQILENGKLIKSPLNYIGGKYRLLKQILPLFPANIETFVDLFSGGANVGINVNAKKHIFNDMNYRINEMFRYFQLENPIILIEKIEKRIRDFGLSKTDQETFLAFRNQYNLQQNPLDLYILSSYSYNFQFRFNNNMKFNNPFGRNRSSFNENMKINLLNFITRLGKMNAIFTDYLFHEFNLSTLIQDDFVYLDPPYLITTGSYNDGNRGFIDWGVEQELKMYDVIKKLNEKKIRFALSNVFEHKGKSHDLLKTFVNDNGFNIHYLDFNYKNSSYNTIKKESIEVLITNY
ncbi:Dam family site-specific DNA-(adenine-N6)-methyltransferase [Orbus wheelerorum]|uniref:Dam family site-specific DNA-(adenine-N6)-methyltransferase n=1 Tax=Orbus wheelerorum TaxID=3074111 RepID=UPI00370D261A